MSKQYRLSEERDVIRTLKKSKEYCKSQFEMKAVRHAVNKQK